MVASDALLGLFCIDDPSDRQRTGAILVAEFMLRVTHFLKPKGGK